MKRILLAIMFLPCLSFGQLYTGTPPIDSVVFRFTSGDSFRHTIVNAFTSTDTAVKLDTGTYSSSVWQIGQTTKTAFTGGTGTAIGIMTDTSGNYPARANAYFYLDIPHLPDMILTFWHRYQTDSLHAGGMVEFSQDSGTTWMNMASCPFTETYNLYTSTDTLNNGQQGFTGSSAGQIMSQIFFPTCPIPIRTTSTSCYPDIEFYGHLWVRFRFVSDSTTPSTAGWKIDSLKLVEYDCPAMVPNKYATEYSISPNPAFTLLQIEAPETIHEIDIVNMTGQVMLQQFGIPSGKIGIDISHLPEGFYWVRVNSKVAGRFLKY